MSKVAHRCTAIAPREYFKVDPKKRKPVSLTLQVLYLKGYLMNKLLLSILLLTGTALKTSFQSCASEIPLNNKNTNEYFVEMRILRVVDEHSSPQLIASPKIICVQGQPAQIAIGSENESNFFSVDLVISENETLTSLHTPYLIKNSKNQNIEIPAGTTVKAILETGIECNNIQIDGFPQKVKLSLLEDERLPKNLRTFLKEGLIIGNVIGDIFNQRVHIAIDSLTVLFRDGTFIEKKVNGYVFDEGNRQGLSGNIIDRHSKDRQIFADLLSKEAIPELADYYKKRYEQLLPVVEISPGRIVNIVFSESIKIEENIAHKSF